MTNRSKSIGTASERAVVRYLAAHGFPAAERRALHGATDLADPWAGARTDEPPF